jgi:hypothetical protein
MRARGLAVCVEAREASDRGLIEALERWYRAARGA